MCDDHRRAAVLYSRLVLAGIWSRYTGDPALHRALEAAGGDPEALEAAVEELAAAELVAAEAASPAYAG